MRNLVILILLLPISLVAQLDRVKIGMTEADFRKKVPEASRNYEDEAYWIKQDKPLGKVLGKSQWYCYRDTITEYKFIAEPAYGPSARYKKADSSAVHQMKMELEKLRVSYTTALGAPDIMVNKSLTLFIADIRDFRCYWVEWTSSSEEVVRLEITCEVESGNQINPSVEREDPVQAEVYRMYVTVNRKDKYFRELYGIGLRGMAFKQLNPDVSSQVNTLDEKIYTINDTAVSPNAQWTFDIEDGILVNIDYMADGGVGYAAKTDSDAYLTFKKKAKKLLDEGVKNYGTPDSLTSNLPEVYKQGDRHLSYEHVFLAAQWFVGDNVLYLEFTEIGGGKNPDTIFYLDVWYEED